MAAVTIRDVARVANVSIATASRALNKTRLLDPEVQKRVESAVVQLGYEPNVMARSLRNGRTHSVALEVRDITVAPLASLVRGAQETLDAAGYALMITCSSNDKMREIDFLTRAAQRRVDGLITTTSADGDPELARALKELKLPVVFFDRKAVGAGDAVLIGHSDGIRQALDYLTSLGHTRIALVTGPETSRPARERVDAFRAFHKSKKRAFDDTLVRARSYESEAGFRETSVLLNRKDRPTAIIAGGTSLLPGVLRAVQASGLSIPNDISVIGGADSDLATLCTPAVTVIRADFNLLGRTAAEMLLERMKGKSGKPTPSREIVFPTELVIRQSCARPAR